MQIINTVATRCQILRLNCTKFDCGWGSTLDPARRAYRPLAGFKGAYFYGKGGRKWKEGKGREEERKEGDGKGRKEV